MTQDILDGVIHHALDNKKEGWKDVFYHWDDTEIYETVKDCSTLDDAINVMSASIGISNYN